MKAKVLSQNVKTNQGNPVIGLFATCDPRIDQSSRKRAQNIIKMTADNLSDKIKLPNGAKVPVVFSDVLIDTVREADIVAKQFLAAGVNVLIGLPDTWAFPQLTLLSLISNFPKDTPLNFTCGNSGPRPGVVFTHAVSGAVAQSGRLMHINVGNWPDEGLNPKMSDKTMKDLIDWTYSAVTYQYLKGKRVVIFGHDSMGMETALPHVIETRNTFGVEITRLDMKLLADMLNKNAYDKTELKSLRNWLNKHAGKRLELKTKIDSERLDKSLAMYLIVRDLMKDLDAVGGGFMSQLEWGSDLRGTPLPVADIMESLFNSSFDHNGKKAVTPYATEADVQGLLTQLFMTYLSGGNPPLFMDFRKVWEGWEVQNLVKKNKIDVDENQIWYQKGFVDGDNSGSASFDWAALPGTSQDYIMKKISFPLADNLYFPGMGNSVSFFSPGGIEGIAARLAYSSLSGMFSMVWDEAETVGLPEKLAAIVANTSNPTWPHTFVTPKHASMHEYKHYAPANHFHMTWNLETSRLQYWMDMTNTLSVTPWQNMPRLREGIDRPLPLLYILNGGEDNSKILRKGNV
ncbi:MAG: hypothetical protein K9H48_09670 [Melioribacteraceae bacterium]|nr:hypothetical protein [Melioribacteraceae bacterium]